MKKLFWILLCLALAFTFAACDLLPWLGGDQGSADGSGCQHTDADNNNHCDKCDESLEDSANTDDPECRHRDANDDNLCDYCGASYNDGDEHEHVYGEWEMITEPTCVTSGERMRRCALCNACEIETIAPHGHSFTEWTTIQAGGCSSAEYSTRFCKLCEFYETDADVNIDLVHPHTFFRIQRAVSCTEDGYAYRFECANCHFVAAEEIIPATGHDFADNEYIGAGDEQHYIDCLNCGKVYSSHVIESFETVEEPTCYNFGISRGTCTVCESSVDKRLDKTHSFAVSEYIVSPSCDTEGVALCYCTGCGVSQEINIGYKHNTIHTIGSAATCTNDGRIEHWFCEECNTYFSSVMRVSSMNIYQDEAYYSVALDAYSYTVVSVNDILIPAKAHNYGSSFNAYNTTHHWQKCVNGCGSEKTRIPHDIKEDFNVEIQETDGGYLYIITYLLYCNDCDYCVSKTYQNALTESHDSYVVKDGVAPTCITDGYTASLLCGECGEVLCAADVIPATGHSFVKQVCVNCGAVQKSEGLSFKLDSSGEYYVFSGVGTCKDSDIVIPPTYNGLPVKAIKDSAFKNLSKITSVTIPDSITSIGVEAFYGCSGITSITIPDGVISIGDYAFYNCNNLTNVVIGNSVTSIGAYAFYGCSSITSITIPDGVTSISDYAFYNCSSLTNVAIGSSVTSIGSYAFYGCSGITSITIPNGVTTIGDSAFSNCSSLTNIVIGKSVTSIGECAFNCCDGLKNVYISDIAAWCNIPFGSYYNNPLYYATNLYLNGELITELVIPDGVTAIPKHAFYKQSSITGVVIPDSVTTIGYEAFYNCDSLTGVVIPDSVTSIGYSAFLSCDKLTSVVIGNNVTMIGDQAFRGCSNLTSVTIPDSVTEIGSAAFEYCSSLTSLVIGNGVTSIGNSAFSSCGALEEIYFNAAAMDDLFLYQNAVFKSAGYNGNGIKVVIGKSVIKIPECLFYPYKDSSSYVTYPKIVSVEFEEDSICETIGAYAFYGCSRLTSLVIPDSVTIIGAYAFSGCSGLTSVVISDGVTIIGAAAFLGCSGLTGIVIPDSVTAIYASAFSGCSGLTGIVIPNNVTTIGSSAFSGCSGITSINIPDSVTSIDDNAFADCSSLASVTLGSNCAANISSSAFARCNSTLYTTYENLKYVGDSNNPYQILIGLTEHELTNYSIHEDTQIIANKLFYDSYDFWDDNLISIVIPDNVTCIGDWAFRDCDSLTSVVIGNSVTSIGSEAFYDCDNLTSVVIPDSVTSIGDYAFYSCFNLTSIVIPDSLTSIGIRAFYDCDRLKDVYISDVAAWCNISFGDNYANPLYYADNLYLNGELITELVIPDGVTAIPMYAFRNQSSITSVIIPDSVTSIGEWAFSRCYSITGVVIGNSVTFIGTYAFYNCYSLTNVVIPESVTTIDTFAFSSCTKLTSVVIGNGVTTIGNYAFHGCYNLKDIYYTGSEEDWAKISITNFNFYLPNVTIHYNYVEE